MPIHFATAYIYTSQHEDLFMLCIVVHVQVGDVYMYYIHMFTAIYIGLKTAAYTLFYQDI